MRLLIARHGETQHNVEGRVTGQTDVALTAMGELQANALAERLRDWHLDVIVSSTLRRAQATAQMISSHHGLEVLGDPDLREIAMGAWEGRPYDAWTDAERVRFRQMEMDPEGLVAAPGGESFAQLAERVHRALVRWQSAFPTGSLLWVTHGGVISVLLIHALGLKFNQRQQFRRGNCSLFEILYEPTRIVIVRANDTSHLDGLPSIGVRESEQAL